MTPPPLLALDFDGVVVDALTECAAMTYHAGRDRRPEFSIALQEVPRRFTHVFSSVRPYCRTTTDFMVARHLDKPLEDLSEFRAIRDTAPDLDQLATQAESLRAYWRDSTPEPWLAAHEVVPQVLQCLTNWRGPRWIVSAKDESSIRTILRHHGAEHLLDVIAGSCDSKTEPLTRASTIAPVVFIDDNLGHVLAAEQLPRVTARWAGWGYAAPEDHTTADLLGITALTTTELATLNATSSAAA